ncbi:hypothetical protein BKA67DRAFT_571936 [Truncatella angustata]|uniref:Uncharacterized protein n=1 Tax=Truncatella angustata TaxID=152316 RepID=A0A9P8ZW65_9PEZI|nr:uncharacterized protein BKA67DRAFT_571936 [Truncatella angustata]KAH6651797.1 hypothetical protein BKA67DRAFT_571936 [Truncatella angustata]
MASMIARRAALSSKAFSSRTFTTTTARRAGDEALKGETKRNPELFILGGIMCLALGGAGLYFGRTPTKSTSEAQVGMTKGGMPWESGSGDGKYQYHPGGDTSAAPKDAPSAVNVVVIPDVNLPKNLHDKYNKWGKDGY